MFAVGKNFVRKYEAQVHPHRIVRNILKIIVVGKCKSSFELCYPIVSQFLELFELDGLKLAYFNAQPHESSHNITYIIVCSKF